MPQKWNHRYKISYDHQKNRKPTLGFKLLNQNTQKWEDMIYTKRMKDIKQKEAKHEAIEDQQADDLLTQI